MKSLIVIVAVSMVVTVSSAQTVYYVTPGGDDNSSGTSWAASFKTIQKALTAAASGSQIWVAAGTYTPSSSDQSAKFSLKNGVAVYGGFVGTESQLTDRNWQTNVTTLSGDIDGDGTLNGNSYHVVYGLSVNSTAVLDGFVVTGGANATDIGGGGIELLFGSPTLSNLVVSGNNSGASSTNFGGGLYSTGGAPVLTNVTFSANHSSGNGGGMYNSGAATISNCLFDGNTAVNGGGLYNDASSAPSMVNIIFRDDSASSLGGGFYDNGNVLALQGFVFDGNHSTLGGGGICCVSSGNSSFTNFTLYHNSSKYGGGMFFTNSCSAQITNAIIWGDSAGTASPEVYNTSGGTIAVSYSILQGGVAGSGVGPNLLTDGGHTIDADPLFTNPNSHDFSLTSLSPAVDAGNNTPVTATLDAAGNTRISDGTVDLGAYEFQGAPLPIELVSFTGSPDGAGALLRWKTASEVNCFGFSVERRGIAQGQSGSEAEQWNDAGLIQGHGTTVSPHEYSFSDRVVLPGVYEYRIKEIDQDGSFHYSSVLSITIGSGPVTFSLSHNYPDPFNPITMLDFTVPHDGNVVLKVYDAVGQEVATLFNGPAKAGNPYHEIFNASGLSSGVYFSRIEYAEKQLMQKMLLIK